MKNSVESIVSARALVDLIVCVAGAVKVGGFNGGGGAASAITRTVSVLSLCPSLLVARSTTS